MSRFTSSQGVKTRDEFLIEGQLNASLEHLKDMRKFSEKLLDAFLEKPMETIEVREIKNK
ncbi:hypothetical protein V8V91_08610 [Algoriphagus halophilus]|uniref:hypothetical protein n=1 Tax=Algoriphagus halophilus TaxID=226505 RepID=UPI00358F3D29